MRLSDKISSVHKFSYYIFKFFLNLGANIRIIGDYLLYLPQVLRFIINVTNNETKQWLENEKVFFRRSRTDGARGQYIIIVPDKNAVIAITSDNADLQGELNLVWERILPVL